jgi:hypothetical protein
LRRQRKKIYDITEITLEYALSRAEKYVSLGNEVHISTDDKGRIKLTSIKKKIERKRKSSKRRLRRSLKK